MPNRLGPHLLGRKYVPDERDWTTDTLHAMVEPPESLLNSTVGQAINESPFFRTWSGILLLWRWIKNHINPPAPRPPPAGGPEWPDRVVLDQGDFGTCVGNGWAGWGDSAPVEDTYTETDARAIYYEATVLDGTPDMPTEPPDYSGGQQGTSVRAGAKAMQNRKRLLAYANARSIADIDEWLTNHGPVVMGTDWTSSMFVPDTNGLIHATGTVEGGHCWLLRWKIVNTTRYRCRNSWGTGWGPLGGDFLIEESDLAKLLAANGDAYLAVELPSG